MIDDTAFESHVAFAEQELLDDIQLQNYQKRVMEWIDCAAITALWLRYNGVDIVHYHLPQTPYKYDVKVLPWIEEPDSRTYEDTAFVTVTRYDFREGMEYQWSEQ